ncbi:hypothetical protein EBT31_19975 [bacterium]|jgi:hypothetical protein|nr:hypothetical protein [bacterium]
MNEELQKVITESTGHDKERFIEEAVNAFRKALLETTKSKHAVFLVMDDADGRMQTYTFNANMTILSMMLTSAYEMIVESEGGPKRVLN